LYISCTPCIVANEPHTSVRKPCISTRVSPQKTYRTLTGLSDGCILFVFCESPICLLWKYACGDTGFSDGALEEFYMSFVEVDPQGYLHKRHKTLTGLSDGCTANLNWDDIFESLKLKARTSLLPHFIRKRHSSFEL